MKTTFTLLAAASLAALANAHGYFTSPQARLPGPLFKSVCGSAAYNQLNSDLNGNIQALEQNTQGQPDFDPSRCHLYLCKGLKYVDNIANIQKYTPGQVVPLHFSVTAPHQGTANVSIVSTWGYGNHILAANLAQWDVYASSSTPIPASQESFSVTMPTTLGTKCAVQGACVIQMHWDAASINQTYQSCIDFTMPAPAAKRDHARSFAVLEADPS